MKLSLLASFLFCSVLLAAQDNANQFDSRVPGTYYTFSFKLIKETPGFTPPVVARAFGFMGLTLYESVVNGMPGYTSTAGKLYGFNDVTLPEAGAEYHWPTVANNAMGMILDSLFRTMTQVNRDSLAFLRNQFNTLFQVGVSPQVYADSKALGEAIAKDVFDYSRTDGGHSGFASNFPSDYIPPTGPSYWVPFGNQVAMQPYWGTHRPFIEEDTSATVLSPEPPPFSQDSGSIFYNLASQVYTTGINLTPEQTTIALYWGDGNGSITPAGHSISILKNILTDKNANLAESALSYAKLGIALSDAFLACWKTKYIYNLCRPVTYIHEFIDTNWLPLITTPPFPEYPSGHSSQSGAMATVMTDIFGSAFSFTDRTHGDNFGGPRTYDSFEEAANEAAVSRLYGGIHFESGNLAGLTLGDLVGENVNELFDQLNVSTRPVEGEPLVSLYPNPTADWVYVKSARPMTGMDYFIYDVYGKILVRGKLDSELTTIPFGQYASGIYLFKTGNDSGHTYRIVRT
jgi:hypothetical protein